MSPLFESSVFDAIIFYSLTYCKKLNKALSLWVHYSMVHTLQYRTVLYKPVQHIHCNTMKD